VAKFRLNADGVLADSRSDSFINGVLNLEKIDDVQDLMRAAAAA
jgi:hypothetical protein